MTIISGQIINDPANDKEKGWSVKFNPIALKNNIRTQTGKQLNAVDNWDVFKGTLLQIHFLGTEFHSVEGSAAMVAPGIALCAKHVFDDYMDELQSGKLATHASAITEFGLQIWNIKKITQIPNTDIVILGLALRTNIPEDRIFNQCVVSTRLPAVNEELYVIGFRAADSKFPIDDPNNFTVEGTVMISIGKVTERYPHPTGRDASLLPWPCIEINCPALGGMSGGPIFDSNGLLVGIVCSSIELENEEGITYASLLYPAMYREYNGGWPEDMFTTPRTLLSGASLCQIDKPEAIVFNADGTIEYHSW